jgi:hypothetical protein
MGTGDCANQVFIIDYGLAKKYRDPHTHLHIPYVEGKSLTGTARYASVAALRGIEQSRRDDLEALGFVWLYLLRGSLPWMGLKGNDQKQKHERICEVKARTSIEELCRGFPVEFVRYFQAVRALKFTERPNYSDLKALFRDLITRDRLAYDSHYDWVIDERIPIAVKPSDDRRVAELMRSAPVIPARPVDFEPATAQPPRPRNSPTQRMKPHGPLATRGRRETHSAFPAGRQRDQTAAIVTGRPHERQRDTQAIGAAQPRTRSARRAPGLPGRAENRDISPRQPSWMLHVEPRRLHGHGIRY